MAESKKKNSVGSTILVLALPAICCGGPLLIVLASAYSVTLVGILRDNALLVVLGLAALGAGAILFLSRRRRRGQRTESQLLSSHTWPFGEE